MIVVTGATGKLGRAIVMELLKRVGADRIGVSVRDPQKATDLKSLGLRVRQGNYDDLQSLLHSFQGAEQVLMISSNARSYGGDPLAQHRSAIDAARIAGVKRVVYTSHMAASKTSDFPPMHDHIVTEEVLRQSGLAWTALRNGFYASSGIAMMGDALTTGVLQAPLDGEVSWTAHDDLAEAAAIVLAANGSHDGPTAPLTASRSHTMLDLADMATALLGRPILRQTITDKDVRTKMAARGAPDRAADTVLGFFSASRNEEFARVDPALEKLLGRPPVGMQDEIAKAVASLRS